MPASPGVLSRPIPDPPTGTQANCSGSTLAVSHDFGLWQRFTNASKALGKKKDRTPVRCGPEWSRGELNPCPPITKLKPLHAYLIVQFRQTRTTLSKGSTAYRPILSSSGKSPTIQTSKILRPTFERYLRRFLSQCLIA
jgi:hypothetical protein